MSENLLKAYNVRSIPGRREFYPHRHNELEIALFRSGRGIYSVTGHDYRIESDCIFMFSNNEIHKITWVDPEIEMEALNLHFPPRLLLENGSAANLGLSRLFFSRREHSNLITRELAGETFDDIRDALYDCERQLSSGSFGAELLAEQSLFRALVLMMRSCDVLAETQVKGRRESVAAIARALEYIDENYLTDIKLETLCGLTRMSRSSFERLFGQLAGVSVSDYIRRRRIDRAIELLETTDLTILSVALASGYHNTANFNKQFRHVTGRTPGAFRAKSREECKE